MILGCPVVPNIQGREYTITSDEAFFLEKLPKHVVIVGKVIFKFVFFSFIEKFQCLGGGYIATEFACIFHGFGCEVTMILRGKTILTAFDEGIKININHFYQYVIFRCSS